MGAFQLSFDLKPRCLLRDIPENLLDFWTIININYVRSEAIILAFDMGREEILKTYSLAVVGRDRKAKSRKTSWSWVTDLSAFFCWKLHSLESHHKLYRNPKQKQHRRLSQSQPKTKSSRRRDEHNRLSPGLSKCPMSPWSHPKYLITHQHIFEFKSIRRFIKKQSLENKSIRWRRNAQIVHSVPAWRRDDKSSHRRDI